MSASRLAAAIVGGIVIYAVLLIAPYGYYLAPIITGIYIGALLPHHGAEAASTGLLAGIIGWAVLVASIGGFKALGLAAGIGGAAALGVSLIYHLGTPALAAYLAARPWTPTEATPTPAAEPEAPTAPKAGPQGEGGKGQ